MSKTIETLQQALKHIEELRRLAESGSATLTKTQAEHLFDARSLLIEAIAAEEAQVAEPMAYLFPDGSVCRPPEHKDWSGYVNGTPLFTRPTNCGSGHCSCVECVMPEPRKTNAAN